MKSEEEKKTRHLRTRMTQNQYKQVKEKADEQNMTVSAYVVEAAVHGDNHITPSMIMQLQTDFNEAANALEPVNPELAMKIRRKGDELWQLL